MTDAKTQWRHKLLALRRTLEARPRATHSAAIVSRLASLPEFGASSVLLMYEPLGAEVDPRALIDVAARSGKVIYRPMEAGADRPGWSPLGSHASNTPFDHTPSTAGEPVAVFVVVPGVGFDLCGTRLGRGRGFYDRALSSLREHRSVFAVGVAFELQVVEALPRDPWDQPVDLIATECRLIVPRPACDSPGIRSDPEEVHNP